MPTLELHKSKETANIHIPICQQQAQPRSSKSANLGLRFAIKIQLLNSSKSLWQFRAEGFQSMEQELAFAGHPFGSTGGSSVHLMWLGLLIAR